MSELTQKEVREWFDYSPTGNLIWKVQLGARGKVGAIAGWAHNRGYRSLTIKKKKYLCHRVIFLWHKGYMPEQVDHKDRDRGNNRIENLREATGSQNKANSVRTRTRFRGVRWEADRAKWLSRIGIDGRTKNLGRFATELEAAVAYDKAARKYFGEFAVCNFPEEIL